MNLTCTHYLWAVVLFVLDLQTHPSQYFLYRSYDHHFRFYSCLLHYTNLLSERLLLIWEDFI